MYYKGRLPLKRNVSSATTEMSRVHNTSTISPTTVLFFNGCGRTNYQYYSLILYSASTTLALFFVSWAVIEYCYRIPQRRNPLSHSWGLQERTSEDPPHLPDVKDAWFPLRWALHRLWRKASGDDKVSWWSSTGPVCIVFLSQGPFQCCACICPEFSLPLGGFFHRDHFPRPRVSTLSKSIQTL